MVHVRKSYHADCCFQRDKILTNKGNGVTNNKIQQFIVG